MHEQNSTQNNSEHYLGIHPKRMEVWYANLERRADSYVQGGNRPVLIVSNDINNTVSPVVTVIPMTGKPKKRYLPTHVWIAPGQLISVNGEDNGRTCGMALAEQITTIDHCQLLNRIGRLEDKELISMVERAVAVQLGVVEVPKASEA